MIKVEDMMTHNPHTLLRSHSLADAKHMMEALDIRHIPVVDADRKLLGVVTQRDVLAAQESSLQTSTSSIFYSCHSPQRHHAQKCCLSVEPTCRVKEVSYLYAETQSGLFTCRKENYELVGIITDSDFVTIAINLFRAQKK